MYRIASPGLAISLVLAASAGILAACSGADDPRETSPRKPTDSGSNLDPRKPDPGTGGEAGLGAGLDDGGIGEAATKAPAKSGMFSVSQTRKDGVVRSIGVQFTNDFRFVDDVAKAYQGCDVSTVAGCRVFECPAKGGAALPTYNDDGGSTPLKSAGVVTFVGGKLPIGGLALAPNPLADYPNGGTGEIFAGGDALSVTAAGDSASGVPPIRMSLAATPSDFTAVTPSFSAPVEMDRSKDFTVTWTGGVDGDARIHFKTIDAGKPQATAVAVVCSVPANAGKIVVAKAAIAKLPVSGPKVISGITLTPTATVTSDFADYRVRLTVEGTSQSTSLNSL